MSQPKILNAQIRDVSFGKRVTIVNPINIYECFIGDDTFIGPFVEIQKGARIGNRCKIQSHVFICEMVTIGNDCFISHGTIFINDLFKSGEPAKGNKKLWRSTRICNKVSIGSNATILPVCICDNVVIGAGSVVTKDIDVKGIYSGNPARLIRKF